MPHVNGPKGVASQSTQMVGVNGIRAQPVLGAIPEVFNESSSTIKSLVEALQAKHHLFSEQATRMEVLTAGLQSLTEEIRHLHTNQVNDKDEGRSMIRNLKPNLESPTAMVSSAMSTNG